ncbi:MAG: hypothetical protein J6V09_06185 [Clostridia bacterium]|nr:hypothetical protein [Clostridia bacterium]
MEFIIIVILVFVLVIVKTAPVGDADSRRNTNDISENKEDDHDPADTFFREDGLDHETDEDGYCEECDDYHDV